MKKIPLLLALAAAIPASAQMVFKEAPFKTLLEQARKDHKLIFVDAYASWCGPCKLMAKNVFSKPAVGDFYNPNFILTKIDMEKGEGVALAKKYGVTAYPTYLFINGEGEVVYRGTGYYEDADFIKIGREAGDPGKQMAEMNKRFEAGEKDPEFLMNFMKVYAFSDAELARKAAVRYFEGRKGQSLSPEETAYLMQLAGNSTTPLYAEIVSRKDELLKQMPPAAYEGILKNLQFQTVMRAAYNKETKVLDERKFSEEAKKILPAEEVQPALLRTRMRLAAAEKNYTAYQKLAAEYYGDGSSPKFTAEELNSVAWNFFEKVEDKAALQNAIRWAQQSVAKDEGYANADTLANLYLKAGDKGNARIWAEKAIALAKKSGEDYASTQKVLDAAK